MFEISAFLPISLIPLSSQKLKAQTRTSVIANRLNVWHPHKSIYLYVHYLHATCGWFMLTNEIRCWERGGWGEQLRMCKWGRSKDFFNNLRGRVKIWNKYHESVDPSWFVWVFQGSGGGVMVWGSFWGLWAFFFSQMLIKLPQPPWELLQAMSIPSRPQYSHLLPAG